MGQGRTWCGRKALSVRQQRGEAGGGVCGLPGAGTQKGATRGRWGLRGP